MRITMRPGETLRIDFGVNSLDDCDGSFTVAFTPESITIEAEYPDSQGREGVIYEEKFVRGDAGTATIP